MIKKKSFWEYWDEQEIKYLRLFGAQVVQHQPVDAVTCMDFMEMDTSPGKGHDVSGKRKVTSSVH